MVKFVNAKANWMLMMGGNYKKIPINMMLNPSNGNMFDFRCNVTNMVQPTINTSHQ
jgi:hypothetical protein